jgi:hypothetical protein
MKVPRRPPFFVPIDTQLVTQALIPIANLGVLRSLLPSLTMVASHYGYGTVMWRLVKEDTE